MSQVQLMPYPLYRDKLCHLLAMPRSTVYQVEQYYGLCLELEAGYCAVKSEVIKIATRLIASYRKHGVAHARKSPGLACVEAMPGDQPMTERIMPTGLLLTLAPVKTGDPIRDFYTLFHEAHDVAAQSLGWPADSFSTRTLY